MAENRAGNKKYDPSRRLIYGGVLIFTVAACISLTAVPAIRARLLDRINVLKTACCGEVQTDILPLGENDIPYPEEFLRPRSSDAGSRPYVEYIQKHLPVVKPGVPLKVKPPALSEADDSGKSAESDEDDDSPRFMQGESERDAYEKTLAANEKLAAMARGGNPDFSLKTWGASRREGDIYWVRVIFHNASGAEVEYIWRTDISSGKSAPLNFNARSL